MRDFKLDLLDAVNEWIDLFKSHLKTRVTDKLNSLEAFIENGKLALELVIAKDDFETLLLVMEVLAQIKEKRLRFNAIFKPLADIVDLLKLYGEEFDVEVYAKVRTVIVWQSTLFGKKLTIRGSLVERRWFIPVLLLSS